MTPEEALTLFTYNAWANQRALDGVSPLAVEQFTKPLGSSFPSVRDTLAHTCGAEGIWLERFQGNSPSSFLEASQFADVPSLRTYWIDQESRLLQFVAGVTQSDLDRVFEYKTMKFGIYRNPLWQSMQHVVNHGTYHRGQVTTMLRQLGGQPLSTDLMHFYRERAVSGA